MKDISNNNNIEVVLQLGEKVYLIGEATAYMNILESILTEDIGRRGLIHQ